MDSLMKKLMKVSLSVMLLITMIPQTVHAEGEYVLSGVTAEYDGVKEYGEGRWGTYPEDAVSLQFEPEPGENRTEISETIIFLDAGCTEQLENAPQEGVTYYAVIYISASQSGDNSIDFTQLSADDINISIEGYDTEVVSVVPDQQNDPYLKNSVAIIYSLTKHVADYHLKGLSFSSEGYELQDRKWYPKAMSGSFVWDDPEPDGNVQYPSNAETWAGTWIRKKGLAIEALETLIAGNSQQLIVYGTNDNITWESSDPAIATVSETGMLKGIKAGLVTITVTQQDTEYTDSITVRILFTDVADSNKYFYEPVYWAFDNGITTGTSGTKFSPNDNCTRGQVVTFLWRAVGCPEPTISNPFTDVTEDKFFYKAVLWAYQNGITTGTSTMKFSPNAKCKREQIVTFLYRTAIYENGGEVPAYTPKEMNFHDVKESNYFYDAVLWAYSTGITTGVDGNTRFGVGQNCIRGMVVTFLKRYKDAYGEPSVIRVDLSTLFIVPSDETVQAVEDVINDYLVNTLHENRYVIDLKITAIGDYLTNIPIELASGDDDSADIVQVFDLSQWTDKGYLQNMDPYLSNILKDTMETIGNVADSGKYKGSYYMIPRYFATVLDWKWIYNKELVEAANIDVSQIHDLDTLEEALAELKAAYPEEYFVVYCNQFDRILQPAYKTSLVGTYTATVGDNTTLYNYYETDAFKDAIYKAYDFRQKGYADPNGSINTLSHDAIVMSGISKGVIMGHASDCESIADMFTLTANYGDGRTHEFGAVSLGIDDLHTDSLGIGIAQKCKDPASAERFINLLYTDEFIWNTLIFGLEGEDYVWNDDHTKIGYPEGLSFNTLPYNCYYNRGMLGNYFQTWNHEVDGGFDSNLEYAQQLMQNAWCPPLYGFVPSQENVSDEIEAVRSVVDQYVNILTYGDVDPDEKYPEFLAALQDAGIDTIIADYQAQVDQWLAENR
ncbi:MAG: extracellular solute-binding protein [Erysipelotrichaceae bacterium]|nr:extracellular solute-binding protein [Erysipelotrichaceae bacterium]